MQIRLTSIRRYGVMIVLLLALGGLIVAIWMGLNGDTPDGQPASPYDAQGNSAFASVVVGDTSDLTGSLVFLEQVGQPDYRIAQLDFATKIIRTVFAIPPDALVYQLAKTADPHQLILTYSPPPGSGQNPYDRNGIYQLDIQDGTVQRLLGEDQPNVYYFYPQRAGDVIYYVIYTAGDTTRHIEAYDLHSHASTLVANDATLPTVSPDGSLIAYFHVNPNTQVRSLWISSTTATGGQALQLIPENTFPDIDAPMFSSDGKWVYFAVLDKPPVTPIATTLNLWPGMYFGMGLIPAHGNHNLPARWYRISATGGDAELVTSDTMVTLSGDFNQDMLGFVSDTGFYVVRSHTVAQIVHSRVMASFAWLP